MTEKRDPRAITGLYLRNHERLKKEVRSGHITDYFMGANLFCLRGREADPDAVIRARELILRSAGRLSAFGGLLLFPLSCALALEADPETRLARALKAYDLLTVQFRRNASTALAAWLLADRPDLESLCERGWSLYQRMREEHRFLTGGEDVPFALLLAATGRREDALIDDMEESYRLLRSALGQADAVQSVSHLLALTGRAPKEKAARVIDLAEALKQRGIPYNRRWELLPLALLACADAPLEELAALAAETDALLAADKAYGFWGPGRRTRAAHAVQLSAALRLRDPALLEQAGLITALAAVEEAVSSD